MPVIIHHEIDKLILVHSSPVPDLFGRWVDIHAFINDMAVHGVHPPDAGVSRRHVLLEDGDCTIGIRNAWGMTRTTAMIRTEALHLRYEQAYERTWQMINALPWVDGGVRLGHVHLCADVMGLRIEDQQFARFDDQMHCFVESERTERNINGNPAVGGVTYRWKRGGEIRVICYDKLAELGRHRKKGVFMRPLYAEKGWDRVQPITRIEIRPTRGQILDHYDAAGVLDLTALWRSCLAGLRYTDGAPGADPAESPTARWWEELLALRFSLRTANTPLPPQVAKHTYDRALAQANGSAVGALAKKLALHLHDDELVPSLHPGEAECIIETALLVDPGFANRVAVKTGERALPRLAIERAPWPDWFVDDVLQAWDARRRSA